MFKRKFSDPKRELILIVENKLCENVSNFIIKLEINSWGSKMANKLLSLEKNLEEALIKYEQVGKFGLALQHYKEVEIEVKKYIINNAVEATQAHKLLAQCYLRQAGMLRQLGRLDEANVINKNEIESARLSGSSITYAQSLFSTGVNLLSNRQIEEGLYLLMKAKNSFEEGNTSDHKQGIGWYWIIQADLGNKGLIKVSNDEIINNASKAIAILTQIQNIPGVERAYQARSIAYKNMGDYENAKADLEKSKSLKG